MTSQSALAHLVCITGKSMTMLCNFQDLQAERSAVLSEAEVRKRFYLASTRAVEAVSAVRYW